jgi:WD40 repeat protein
MRSELPLIAASLIFLSAHRVESQEIVKGTDKTRHRAVAFSPDNNQILAVPVQEERKDGPGEIYRLHAFDLKKKTKLVLLESNTGWPSSVVFTPDGNEALAGGSSFFGGWHTDPYECFFQTKGRENEATGHVYQALTAPKRGSKIAYTYWLTSEHKGRTKNECKLVVWDFLAGCKDEVQMITKDKFDGFLYFQLAFSDSGDLLGHWNPVSQEIVVHNTAKFPYKEVVSFSHKVPERLHVTQLFFSPDDRSLWVREHGKLHQFDFANKKKLQTIEMDKYTNWFQPLADNKRLMICERDHKQGKLPIIRFRDIEKGTEKRVELEKNVDPVILSPDQSLLAGCGLEGGIYIWNVADLQKRAK